MAVALITFLSGPEAMGTISARAMRQAGELRTLLRDGALPHLGIVDVGAGSRLSFALAVGVTLADLARFTAWEQAGREVDAARWRQLGDDLERLHRLATSA